MKKFSSLDIRPEIKDALKEMKLEFMTPIQEKCIEPLLSGEDLIGAAKTGSGKTLAFLVPLVNKVLCQEHSPRLGTLAFIISPTRELSFQIFNVLQTLVSKTDITTKLIIGKENKRLQARSLKKGVSIVVGTPGRLSDILFDTPFVRHYCNTLVFDEADQLMKEGFMDDMTNIVKKLPGKRQTVLFSATLGQISSDLIKMNILRMKNSIKTDDKELSVKDKVFKLAFLSMRDSCVCVDLICDDDNDTETRTNSQLKQYFILTKQEDKFKKLCTWLRHLRDEKNIVFMATTVEVQYYNDVFTLSGLKCLCMHGNMTQSERFNSLTQFEEARGMTLFCTDLVGRGLDIDNVDNVIQYDPPNDIDQYIHRVGRTARAGKSGCAYLFLREDIEEDFLKYLKRKKITLRIMKFDHAPFEKLIRKVRNSSEFHQQGIDAYTAFLNSYRAHPMPCFKVAHLHLEAIAESFLLREVPDVAFISQKEMKKLKKSKKLEIMEKEKKRKKELKRKASLHHSGDAEQTPDHKKIKL